MTNEADNNSVGDSGPPERIWAFKRHDGGRSWYTIRLEDTDVEYIRADLARADSQPAGQDEVSMALAQLREWFPDEEIGVDLRMVRGNAKGNYDAAGILLVHAEQYFDGNSMAVAMQKVREYKEQA